MKVEVKITQDLEEAYAVIYTSEISDEVQEAVAKLNSVKGGKVITVLAGEKLVILSPEDIYMIRVENGKTVLYSKSKSYISKKRLYELLEQLGSEFIQISKSAAVNFSHIDSIEPYLNGMMCMKLKNGMKDYISRKYLVELKKYLGIGE